MILQLKQLALTICTALHIYVIIKRNYNLNIRLYIHIYIIIYMYNAPQLHLPNTKRIEIGHKEKYE